MLQHHDFISPRQYVSAAFELAPVTETDFSHRLTAYNRWSFLWTIIPKTSPRIIRSKIVIFRISNISVIRLYDRMLSSQVAQTLKSMDIFRTLGSRSLSVTAMLNFSGKANTSIRSLGEDDMATLEQGLRR